MKLEDLQAPFERDGFVSLPGFFDDEELERVRSELARFRRDVVPTMPVAEVYFEDKHDPTSVKQLQQLGRHDAFFDALGREGKLPRLAEALLGEPGELRNVQFFDKPAGLGRPTPPHQDGAYFPIQPKHAVTMWLALEDVGEEQGCVRYVRGSHRQGLREHTRSSTLGFSQHIADYDADSRTREVAFPCRAGHLLAHHSLTIHRAAGNRSPDSSRQALGFIYYAARCVVDDERAAAYQARLAAELGAAGQI